MKFLNLHLEINDNFGYNVLQNKGQHLQVQDNLYHKPNHYMKIGYLIEVNLSKEFLINGHKLFNRYIL